MKASEAVRLNMPDLDQISDTGPDYDGGNPYWSDPIDGEESIRREVDSYHALAEHWVSEFNAGRLVAS